MSVEAAGDHLALIRIDGMHCHKCEQAIQKAILAHPGVFEVEVDFNSGQASVLFDKSQVTLSALVNSVAEAGYHPASFTEREG